MKIYYVAAMATEEKIETKETEFEAKESKTLFIVNKPSNFGGKTTQVKKTDILKIDSMARLGLCSPIHRHTWSLPESLTTAKESVFIELKKAAKKQAEVSNKILSHFK